MFIATQVARVCSIFVTLDDLHVCGMVRCKVLSRMVTGMERLQA